ncbi:MAG: hypothetical protein ONA69_08755 [candidate division KSB1 bacterium]|nr:hypothetical protein [candidate division KSB1 bacterium]
MNQNHRLKGSWERLFNLTLISRLQRKRVTFVLAAIIFCFLLLIIYSLRLFGPTNTVQAIVESEKEIVPPQRPGTSGIVLSGPMQKPLLFQIDFTKPGMRAIDWNVLQSLGTVAAIIVDVTISNDGRVAVRSVNDRGFPHAGAYVRQCIDSWAYTPYMNGNVTFAFRVGANRVDIFADERSLMSNNPAGPQVKIGRLINLINDRGVTVVLNR